MPLKAWAYICVFSQFVLLCVARGLATGRFHSRGVLPHFRKQIGRCIIWEVVRCLLLVSNPSVTSGMHVQLLGRFHWPRGLRRGSAPARLLRLWVRILPGAWISVSCECCVLSGRGLCVGMITRPEESCRVWCVSV